MTSNASPDNKLSGEISALREEIKALNNQRFLKLHNSTWRIIGLQLLRGLSFGFGSVIGATILVSVIAWWLSQFEFLPIIGDWASEIAHEMQKSQER